jgi:lysozyme
MNTSQQGLQLLIAREDKRTAAYLDTRGIPTIGIGHTGPEVHMGLVWSEAQIEQAFDSDIAKFEAAVSAAVKVPLNQNQFDALVSFSHNAGQNALAHGDHGGPCSILRSLNAGAYAGAAAAFNNWCNPPEITPRRMGEKAQFMGTQFVARIGADGRPMA